MYKLLACKQSISLQHFTKQTDIGMLEESKQIVHSMAKTISDILKENKISSLVSIGSSFAWIADYIGLNSTTHVHHISFSKGTLTENPLNGVPIPDIFNLDLYRKHIPEENIIKLREIFNLHELSVERFISEPLCILDMSKTGKGLRSIVHEIERMVVQKNKENPKEQLKKLQNNLLVLVFQPKIYRDQYPLEILFKDYKLFFLPTSGVNEENLEALCDNDENRLIKHNPIDGNYEVSYLLEISKNIEDKRSFYND